MKNAIASLWIVINSLWIDSDFNGLILESELMFCYGFTFRFISRVSLFVGLLTLRSSDFGGNWYDLWGVNWNGAEIDPSVFLALTWNLVIHCKPPSSQVVSRDLNGSSITRRCLAERSFNVSTVVTRLGVCAFLFFFASRLRWSCGRQLVMQSKKLNSLTGVSLAWWPSEMASTLVLVLLNLHLAFSMFWKFSNRDNFVLEMHFSLVCAISSYWQ